MKAFMNIIAVLPPGLELEGASELIALGAKNVYPLKRAVKAVGDTECLYRLYLRARIPFQILRELTTFNYDSPEDLYYKIQQEVDWKYWLHPSKSFKVKVTGSSIGLTHTHFTALKVKDAIVNRQMDLWGKRSLIDLEDPNIYLHVHLSKDDATLSLNGTSKSLHRRGWRPNIGVAPLKENLAAGLMQLTGWDGSISLLDPVCGSGTFLIEAARKLIGKEPGLEQDFALMHWTDFDNILWTKIKMDTIERLSPINTIKIASIIGIEKNKENFEQAVANAEYAHVNKFIEFKHGDFRDYIPSKKPGLIVCNPPYGIRINANEGLEELYSDLGFMVKQRCKGWQMWLLSGNPRLTGKIRMKASRNYTISNGGIDCRWLNYEIH